MKIRIYQIDIRKDDDRVAFTAYNNKKIKSEIYNLVFDGTVDCETLEDVYRMFNIDRPDGYTGRSLSVSDIVEVIHDNASTFNYCDVIGFKEVEFDANLARKQESRRIKVVMCEPGKRAKVTEVECTLEGLQAAVNGDIEAYYPFNEEVCIVCNEEGKFNGMEPNRAVYGEDHEIMDVVYGPFIICDCSGESFGSLNEAQLEKYSKLFEKPEHLARVNGKLVAIPYDACESNNEETEAKDAGTRTINLCAHGETYGLLIRVERYFYGNGLALSLVSTIGEPFATLTKNLDCPMSLPHGYAFVDAGNCEWAEAMIEKYHLGRKTGIMMPCGFCEYPLFDFNLEEIKKYCVNPDEI